MAEAFTWFSKFTDVLEQVPDEGMRQRLAYAIVMYGSMGAEPGLEWPLNALFEAVREDLDNSRAARERGRNGGRPRKASKNEVATKDAGDARDGRFGRGTTDDPGFDAQKAAPTDPAMVPEATPENGSEGLETRSQIGFGLDETTGLQTQKPDVQTGFANPKTSLQTGFPDSETTLQTGFENQKTSPQTGFANPKTSLQTGFPTSETQTKPNQTKPNQTRPDQTRPDQTKGEGRASAPTPPPKKPKRFKPPTVAEVEAYGRESGYVVNPIAFTSWHESKGWKVGNQPMKDWRAAVRSWWAKDHPNSAPPRPQGTAPKKRSTADELADVESRLAAMEGGA